MPSFNVLLKYMEKKQTQNFRRVRREIFAFFPNDSGTLS